MGRFARILLKVNARQRHRRKHPVRPGSAPLVLWKILVIERNLATHDQRLVILADLIILRHVRIEIIFAIPFAKFRGDSAEQLARQDGHFDGLLVEDRQGTRQPQAGRTGPSIRVVPVTRGAGAKHLAPRLEVDVDFKTNGRDVVGNRHGKGKKSE